MRNFIIAFAIIAISFIAAHAWFAVPMAYWDKYDGTTGYFALGFGDTTKYGAAEIRYAPKTKAIHSELSLDLPLMGVGTQLYGRYIKAETYDPRKTEIILFDRETTITDTREDIEEYSIRLNQKFKAGIESYWGIFVDYRQGKYFSDYKFKEFHGFMDSSETTEIQYMSGGINFGYDTRHGKMDPQAGYTFNIEVGANYLLTDTLKVEADYIGATTRAPKYTGYISIDQFVYTPMSSLPIDIPLLTVSAPTIIGLRTSGAYCIDEVPQILACKASDFSMFRGVPPRKLSGYAYFILAGDIRISPITRMYTPWTLVHLLAPAHIKDIRADLEIIPSIDIGKIFYGEKGGKQFYSWGLGLGLKFTDRLTARLDIDWCPTFDNYVTTYFHIRQPF